MQCTTYWCIPSNIFKNNFQSEINKHVLIKLFVLSISMSCVPDLVTVVASVTTIVHVTDTCDWCGADVTPHVTAHNPIYCQNMWCHNLLLICMGTL